MKKVLGKILLSFVMIFAFVAVAMINNHSHLEASAEALCPICGKEYVDGMCPHYQPADFNEGTNQYEISNLGQLMWFSQEVNNGNNKINACLVDDIVIENLAWEPIGTYEYPYEGKFIGNGHNVHFKSYYTEHSNSGLFGVVNYATIKELNVSGRITVVQAADSEPVENIGVIAHVLNYSTIFDIFSSIDYIIEGKVSKVGGIIGNVGDPTNSDEYITFVRWVEFSGSIYAEGECDYIGGLIGYINLNTDQRVQALTCVVNGSVEVNYSSNDDSLAPCISLGFAYSIDGTEKDYDGLVFYDSLFTGEFKVEGVVNDKNVGYVFGHQDEFSDGNAYGIYYCEKLLGTNALIGTSPDKDYYLDGRLVNVPEEELISGKFIIDHEDDFFDSLGQKLKSEHDSDYDLYPRLYGQPVYRTYNCVTYTNVEYPNNVKPHEFENSKCKLCNCPEPPKTDEYGNYLIYTAEDWVKFANFVNAEGYSNNEASVILMNNIDLSSYGNEVIIGTKEVPFKGSFYGNNCSIKINLSYDTTELPSALALFAYVSSSKYGSINDLRVFGDIKVDYLTTKNIHVAGLIGDVSGDSIYNIYNVYSFVNLDINGGDFVAAGLIGKISNAGDNRVKITKSAYMGSVELVADLDGVFAGFVGTNYGDLEISDSFVAPVISPVNSNIYLYNLGKEAGVINANNSYVVGDFGAASSLITALPGDALLSGELTYKLNGGVTDGSQEFYQTVGEGYPDFSGKTVYYGYFNCDLNKEAVYTNNSAVRDERADHKYIRDCDTSCEICGFIREASHSYDLPKRDSHNHWMECECGAILAESVTPHVYEGEWEIIKEATIEDKGEKVITCECGHKHYEEIARIDFFDCSTMSPAAFIQIFSIIGLLATAVLFIRKK